MVDTIAAGIIKAIDFLFIDLTCNNIFVGFVIHAAASARIFLSCPVCSRHKHNHAVGDFSIIGSHRKNNGPMKTARLQCALLLNS